MFSRDLEPFRNFIHDHNSQDAHMAPKETVRTAKNEFELSMNSSLVVRAF
jgi:hypothetical protein